MNCTSKIGHNFGGAVFLCKNILKSLRIKLFCYSKVALVYIYLRKWMQIS